VTVHFMRDLGAAANLKNATGSASFASLFNNDTSHETTFAVNCVQVASDSVAQTSVATLKAAMVVQGGGGNAGISRITYQANAQVAIPFQILVSGLNPAHPPDFQPQATVTSGNLWAFQVTLPSPAPSPTGTPVHVASNNAQAAVVVPPTIHIPEQSSTGLSAPQRTAAFTFGPDRIALITATFGAFSATATLRIIARGT
jgi:hypothetical protein